MKQELTNFLGGNSLPLHHPDTLDLDRQVEMYLTYGHPVLELNGTDTLVAIWIGINDVNDSQDYDVDFEDFYTTIITTLFESITDLYDLGYVNFLFVSLPPLDRTPSNVANEENGEPVSPSTEQINLWSSILNEAGEEFGETYPETTVLSFDAYEALNEVLDNFEDYGLETITEYVPHPRLYNPQKSKRIGGMHMWEDRLRSAKLTFLF